MHCAVGACLYVYLCLGLYLDLNVELFWIYTRFMSNWALLPLP